MPRHMVGDRVERGSGPKRLRPMETGTSAGDIGDFVHRSGPRAVGPYSPLIILVLLMIRVVWVTSSIRSLIRALINRKGLRVPSGFMADFIVINV